MIKAVPSIIAGVPVAVHLIAEDAAYESELQRLAKERNIEYCFLFARAIWDCERKGFGVVGDAVRMPSGEFEKKDGEGFGGVLSEANAC